MSQGQKPDPRRKKTAAPRSTNFKVPNGKSETGYMAGQVYGCHGHRVHAHQPCLTHLTGGELSCPLCVAGLEVVWRGYVPIWDLDFTLRHALINEDYFESVDMIPHRAAIIASRDKAPISPLVIRAVELKTFRQLPMKEPWSVEVDMYAICRKLWKNATVDAWYASTHGRITEGVGDAQPLDVDGMNPMYRAAADRANRMSDPAVANARTVEQWKKSGQPPGPSKNGHHKKGSDNG